MFTAPHARKLVKVINVKRALHVIMTMPSAPPSLSTPSPPRRILGGALFLELNHLPEKVGTLRKQLQSVMEGARQLEAGVVACEGVSYDTCFYF